MTRARVSNITESSTSMISQNIPQSPNINRTTMDRDNRRDGPRRPDDRGRKPRYGMPILTRNRQQDPNNIPDRTRERTRSRSPPRRDTRGSTRERSPFRRSPPPATGPRRGGPNQNNHNNNTNGNNRPPTGPRNNRSGPRTIASDAINNAVRSNTKSEKPAPSEPVQWEPQEGEDEEAVMQRIMGFTGFKTTKNTKVPGNEFNYAVRKVKKAEYRQYMNRVGGFNRPLSPSRM
jgi:U4/U6.U5 tri-snRNP-associated protein 3